MNAVKDPTVPLIIIAHTTIDCPLCVPEIDSSVERTTVLSFTKFYGKQASELKT